MRADRLFGLLLLLVAYYAIVVPMMLSSFSKEAISATTLQLMDLPMQQHHENDNDDDDDSIDVKFKATRTKYKEQEYTCDAQNSPDMLSEGDVIRRALHAVVIGTMKGGTQALHTLLTKSHPRILNSGKMHGELQFFTRQGLRKNLPRDNPAYRQLDGNAQFTIPRQDLRDGFQYVLDSRDAFKVRQDGKLDIQNDMNRDKFGIHSAPIYIFNGRNVPARMLCVAPWVKVIVILRNPIERAFSHYNFISLWPDIKGRIPPTFDQFIQNDLKQLTNSGVIRKWTSEQDFESFSGSNEESEAWEKYSKFAKNMGPVGRGLYSIQLEMWIDEYKKINKSVEDDLLILRSEETKENPQDAYHEAVQFLGLEVHTTRRKDFFHKAHHKTEYTHEGMSDETYKLLYDLYKPYNKRLAKLLGDDWDGVWDDDSMQSRGISTEHLRTNVTVDDI